MDSPHAEPDITRLPDDIIIAILRCVSLAPPPSTSPFSPPPPSSAGPTAMASPLPVVSAPAKHLKPMPGTFQYALVCRRWHALGPSAHARASVALKRSLLEEQELVQQLRSFTGLTSLHLHASAAIGHPARATTPSSGIPAEQRLLPPNRGRAGGASSTPAQAALDEPSARPPRPAAAGAAPPPAASTAQAGEGSPRSEQACPQPQADALPESAALRDGDATLVPRVPGPGEGGAGSSSSSSGILRAGMVTEALFLGLSTHLPQLRHVAIEAPSKACVSADALDVFFRNMTQLRRLELRGMRGAYSLPSSLSCLVSLRHLVTPNAHSLPPSLSALSALRTLVLRNVGLTSVPNEITLLSGLRSLQLYCSHMATLPAHMGGLTTLTSLTLFSRGLRTLPASLLSLSALRSLHLTCPSLLELPLSLSLLSCLESVRISAWWQAVGNRDPATLRGLAVSLRELKSLKFLEFTTWGCRARVPPDLGLLTSLLHLHMRCYSSWGELPPSLSDLSSLRLLSLSHPASSLPPQVFAAMGALTALDIHNCFRLRQLDNSIGGLRSLRTLTLTLCLALRSLPPNLGSLEALLKLVLDRCPELTELPASLGSLEALRELAVVDCGSLQGLPSTVGGLQALQHLRLQKLASLAQLPPELGLLRELRQLHIDGLKVLRELPSSLCLLPALEGFHVSACPLLGRVT